MEIRIEYIEYSSSARITAGGDISASLMNRIKDIILGVEPDANIINNTILVKWSTILSSATKLAYLHKSFGLIISHNESAKRMLLRYRDEVREVRAASGSLRVEISEEEVSSRLNKLGFVGRELKPYQKRDVVNMVRFSNGANFSVPGAGKTTVTFAAHLLTRDTDTRLLVIAPKNAFSAWDDVIKDCMDSSIIDSWAFTRLTGGVDSIQQILQNPPMRMLITYEQLTRVQDMISLLLTNYKVHVILDESHRMKSGSKSQRGDILLRLAHLPIRRDILSGTPIPRSIDDIIPQLEFIWPGQSLGWRATQSEDPHEVLKDLYVRTTKRELRLPEVVREFIPVPMSNAQMALYSVVRQEVIKRRSGIKMRNRADLASANRSVMRLLQISSNPILMVRKILNDRLEDFRYEDPVIEAIFKSIIEEYDSPKILKACELARGLVNSGEKCVIWSTFTENVERIAELMEDLGSTYIHGQVDTGDENDPMTREGRIKAFHDPNGQCNVLVANPAACSEGISLHKVCHHAIYVDRSFNAGHYLQSVDRIHRLGLEEGQLTYIHVLESIAPNAVGSIDYSVRRRLITKLKTMYDVLRDFDLHRLALDEEEEDAPIDYDITFDDLVDIIEELVGAAQAPGYDEVL